MELVKWEKIRNEIEQAKDIDVISDMRDKLKAYETLAKQRGESIEVKNKVGEYLLRADRKLGQWLKENLNHEGTKGQLISRGIIGVENNNSNKSSLNELKIDKHKSSMFQKIANLSEEKFEEIIKTENELNENVAVKIAKKIDIEDKIQKQQEAIEKGEFIGIKGTYEVIVIDPPWEYNDSGNFERGHLQYPTMSQIELKEINIPCSTNCILFLWTTNSFMKDAYELLEEWGFEDKTILTWHKGELGMGNYLRNVTEHCILATRGNVISEGIIHNNNKFTTHLFEKKEKHSAKPDSFYKMINEICSGRKLDYFARKKREGWDVYGDEVK
jgi:N6-adenosine-specific RNA methylase IME4